MTTDVIAELTALLAEDVIESPAIEADEEILEDGEEILEEDAPDDDNDDDNDDEDDEDDDEDDALDVLTDEYDDVKVKIGDEEITLSELKSSFLRHSDYTKKTQELAHQRKEVEARATELEQKANQRIQDRFNMVSLEVEKKLKVYSNTDWKKLAATDPKLYATAKEEFEQTRQDAFNIEKEYRAMQQQQQEIQQKKLEEQAQQSYTILKEAIPGWNKDLYIKVCEYAVGVGMSEDVVTNIVDAPSLILIYKAMKADGVNTELKDKVSKKKLPPPTSKLKNGAKKEAKSVTSTDLIKKLNTTSDRRERSKIEADLVSQALGL